MSAGWLDLARNAFGPGRLRPASADDAIVDDMASQDRLVVLLHQYGGNPKRDLQSIAGQVRRALPDAAIFAPVLPLHYTSFADPNEIVAALLGEIAALDEQQAFARITIVGHSMGSLIARKLFVAASGELPGYPLEPPLSGSRRQPWADKIDRIVLLAGMNRGWSFSHHLGFDKLIGWRVGLALLGLIRMARTPWRLASGQKTADAPPIVARFRRGAPFASQLRLQWIALRQHLGRQERPSPLTVQLLGSIDDMVSPDDNVDPVAGHDFVYLDVPHTAHVNAVFMDATRPADAVGDTVEVKQHKAVLREMAGVRAAIFRDALVKSEDDLKKRSVTPFDKPTDAAIEHIGAVVFVIHGIRDLGYWTQKIARRVRAAGLARQPEPLQIATETASYGYFAMLPFLTLRQRKDKVEWLMERYVEARAHYPNAEFHYVGHSNGTWLLARLLETYPACRFKHVVFAGSVVRKDKDWRKLHGAGSHGDRIGKLCNFVAAGDWVVALFPRAFEILARRMDLGSAGHSGFDKADGHNVVNVKYVRGGHGAAIVEDMWDSMAHFIVTGQQGALPQALIRPAPVRWIAWLGERAPFPLIVIVAFFLGIGAILAFWPGMPGLAAAPEWLRTVLVVFYLWLLYLVVTRV